jgi:xanthine dehydrogenase YagS FAD-binding subunit
MSDAAVHLSKSRDCGRRPHRHCRRRAGTRFLAGGTTLYDLMKLDVEVPSHIVDINSLSELEAFDTSGSNELVFGALARMSNVAADPRLIRDYPALSESLWRAASQQLRNMASLGGNLLQRTRCAYYRGGEPFACNKRKPGSGCAAQEGINRGHALLGGSESCIAVYPGDFAVALVAFDAKVDVLGPGGRRTIELEQFAPRAWQHASSGNDVGAGRIDLAHPRADNTARPHLDLS